MADKIDFKKSDKALYLPKTHPSVVDVPEMKFITISGSGNSGDAAGKFAAALKAVHYLSCAIKLDKANIADYKCYTVPPVEVLWYPQDGADFSEQIDKERALWKIMLRQPDFVDESAFNRAREVIQRRKKIQIADAKLEVIHEGLCVQCMHIGAYNDETSTGNKILRFIAENDYLPDINSTRAYHEIYISSPPRQSSPINMKIVIRYPVRQSNQ